MLKNKQQGLLLFSILVVLCTFVISSPKVSAATIKNEKDLLLSLPSFNQNQPSGNSQLPLPKPKAHFEASRSISVSSNDVTAISNCQQLQDINHDEASLAGNYILSGNIDCTSATREGGALWNDGAGFEPIGRAATPFTGIFNGNGKTITGLYINRPDRIYVGLFGKNSGQIENLNVYDVEIIGGENTGAVVGSNRGMISNAHSSGSINYELAEWETESMGGNYWDTVMNGDNPVHVYFYHWTAPTTQDITLVAPGNYDYFPAIVFLASDTPGLDGNWSGTPVAEGTFSNKMPTFHAEQGVEYTIALTGGNNSSCGRTIDLAPFLTSLGEEFTEPAEHTFDEDSNCSTTPDSTESDRSIYDQFFINIGGLVGFNDGTISRTSSSAIVNAPMAIRTGQNQTLLGVGGLVGTNFNYYNGEGVSESTASGDVARSDVAGPEIDARMPTFHAEQGVEYTIALTGGNNSSCGRTIDLAPFLTSLGVEFTEPAEHTFDNGPNCQSTDDSTLAGNNYWNTVMNGDNPVHVYFYHWTAPTTQDITLVAPGNYDYFPAIVFLASDTPGLDGNWSGTPVAEGDMQQDSSDNTGAFGGLVGINYGGDIYNSYSKGDVTGGVATGGLVAYSFVSNIQKSYSTGSVSGSVYDGGLVGIDQNGTITDSFWDKQSSGLSTSFGGTGKTTAEMKDVATYTQLPTAGLAEPWDFVGNPNNDVGSDNIWTISSNSNSGYPCLAWQGDTCSLDGSSGSDTDNISDTVENAAPNNGDANNDGTPDAEQDNVASFVDPVSGKYSVLQVNNECSITSVSTAAESANTTQDSGYNYPTGLMDFTLDCGTNGFTADITQYYYGQDSSDFIVRKYNPDTKTYSTIDGAELSDQTIDSQSVVKATYQVKDGGSLDLDGTEDGNIHDPAGLATSTDALANTGQNTNPLILLSSILLTSGLVIATYSFNRRRKGTHATTKN